MLEFLGFVFLAYCVYIFVSSDELYIDIKIEGKSIIHYERKK